MILVLIGLLPAMSTGTSCFHCVSPDLQYNATVRRQFATQSDIFFYPIGVKSGACSSDLDVDDPIGIEGQICSKYNLCVTLFPNLPNTTFVIRGCMESILRHAYREDERLKNPGCFLVRSLPMFPNTSPMDYVICTCQGDYCNRNGIPDIIPANYSFSATNMLRLTAQDSLGTLKITSSSAIVPIIAFFITIIFHFI